jgi:LmbE family N-acetylglucosaminyl deacetylase
MPTESILVFSAHNDDQIIGAGGTLAKYAKEGKEITVFIFSFGESSHPHFHKEEIIKTRVRELIVADEVLNIKRSYHLGLKEGDFFNDFTKKKRTESIIRIIKEKNPEKIFTHSMDDPHPDHKAVNNIILSILKESNYKGEIYTFDVWNPFNLRNRNLPKLVVDITDTFQAKVKALRCHDSQVLALITMVPGVYVRGILNGLQYGKRYCEQFTKIQ